MANKLDPYRRPTRAQLEAALTALAVEHMYRAHDEFAGPARTPPTDCKDWGEAAINTLYRSVETWRGDIQRKLIYVVGRVEDCKHD